MSDQTGFTQYCYEHMVAHNGEHICELASMGYGSLYPDADNVDYAPISPRSSLYDDTALWGGLYESSQLHTPLGHDLLVDHNYALFGDHLFV